MDIENRIAGFSDKQVQTLHENALRLAETGDVLQRTEALRLAPILAAELEERTKLRNAERKAKRAVTRQAALAGGRA